MRRAVKRKRRGFGLAWAIAASAWAVPAAAQSGRVNAASPAVVGTVDPELAAGAVRRQIDDPHSGLSWLLVADPAHPGGPGRLVSLTPDERKAMPPKRVAKPVAAKPVIWAGEAVQVEEHSPVLDVSLQAVALGSAAPGSMLRVRLRIGGRVLRVRALAAGRAAIEPAGGRP